MPRNSSICVNLACLFRIPCTNAPIAENNSGILQRNEDVQYIKLNKENYNWKLYLSGWEWVNYWWFGFMPSSKSCTNLYWLSGEWVVTLFVSFVRRWNHTITYFMECERSKLVRDKLWRCLSMIMLHQTWILISSELLEFPRKRSMWLDYI